MAETWEVQKQLKSYDTSGAKQDANPDEWETVSGYGSKASANAEVKQLRAQYDKKGYRLRVHKSGSFAGRWFG